MSIGRRWLAIAVCVLLTACTSGEDAGVRAVLDARSAVVVAQNATRLLLDGRATGPYTQVVLSDTLDAVGDAEQELREASDVDPGRVARARAVVREAEQVVDELADAGADRLAAADLDRLTDLVRSLDAALAELGR